MGFLGGLFNGLMMFVPGSTQGQSNMYGRVGGSIGSSWRGNAYVG